MRLGCCGSLDQARAFKDAGFDFVEVNVQAVLRGDEPDSQWLADCPDPAALPLPVEAANCLVPGNHPIVGPERNMADLTDYMSRVAERAGRLGMRRLVFGSGGARKRPDGVDPRTAADQLAEFTRMAGDLCAKHEVTMVIEHLNRKETNTLNTLVDALALCERAGSPGVGMLVDSYHFGLEAETDEALLELGDSLAHVHLAEPVDRIQPGGHGGDTTKAFDFANFFALLHKIGYDQRLSLECGWKPSFEAAAPACAAMLRQTWETSAGCEE